MQSIITTFALVLSLSLTVGLTGCGGDDGGSSCDKVTEHTLSIMPDELKKQMGDKKALVEKCEKELSADDRKCALGAKDLQGLMECSAKAKQRKS